MPPTTPTRLAAAGLLALGLLAGPTAGQWAPFALGPQDDLTVVAHPLGGGAPVTAVSGARLRPWTLTGAAPVERLRVDRPAVVDALGATPRVTLPGGGALYRVRHAGLTSLLHVDADGLPGLLLSGTDVGAVAGLLPELAVSTDGTRALVAEPAGAGGNVLVADLSSGLVASLTTALPALTIEGASLTLAGDDAWFVADGLLHHADLAGAAAAAPVPLGQPAGFAPCDELAVSADGSTVAAVVEDDLGDRLVYVVAAGQPPVLVTPAPGAYDTPSFDAPDGPHLALSADGSLVAWRATIDAPLPALELFVRRVTQPAGNQVTADGTFIDTLDDVIILGFTTGGTLLFLVGEGEPDVLIDSADVFRADVDATGALTGLQNLTQTSGLSTPPFFAPGELEVTGLARDPVGERVLLGVDPQGADGALLTVDPTGASATLLAALEAPPQLERAGEHVLVVSEPDTGPGVPPGTQAVHVLAPVTAGGAFTTLGTVPPGVQLGRFAVDDAGDRAAFTVAAAPGLELLVGVDLVTAVPFLWWGESFALADALAFAPDGALLAGLGGVGGPFLFARFEDPFVGALAGPAVGPGFPLGR